MCSPAATPMVFPFEKGISFHNDESFVGPDHQKAGEREIQRKDKMLHYTLVFLLVALLAGAFGFFGVAGMAASIAKILFFLFLVLFIVSLITGKRKV